MYYRVDVFMSILSNIIDRKLILPKYFFFYSLRIFYKFVYVYLHKMWIHSFTFASSKKYCEYMLWCFDHFDNYFTFLFVFWFTLSRLYFNKDFQYQLNSLCIQMALENLDKWEIFFVSYREHPLVLNYKEAGLSTYQP